MSKYNMNKSFRITEIKSPITTTWLVPKTALADQTNAVLPPVLATTNLIDTMQSTSLKVLSDSFRYPHCEIAVAARISVTHSAPVPAGVTLSFTIELQRRDDRSNTFEFAVTACDEYGIVASATFWNAVTCSVNLESAALLRRTHVQARVALLGGTGTAPDCPGGKGFDFTTRPPLAFESPFAPLSPLGTPLESLLGDSDGNNGSSDRPPPCRLCHPLPRRVWHGPEFAHTRVSRGFLHAVHHGFIELVTAWLDLGCSSSGIDLSPYLDSALYAAVFASRPSILDLLADKAGADPVAWKSPYLSFGGLLHLAVQNSNLETVSTLLRRGVDPDSWDGEYYWTPLHHAARLGHIEMSQALLASGADPDVKEDEGWTSLHFAVQRRDAQMVRVLVGTGAGIEKRNALGDTPVMMAVRLGYRDIVQILLGCGCHPGLGEGRPSAVEWLQGVEVRDLCGPVRSLRP
ncbi:ankyrin repeat-containing domain protein [Aspergillus pseudoustus]|uniref:Ankyrin repeat-containing domain protein n=1 Tax=Aspergillus pseudoustus TaxID=1810923 RepID=A0ABR4K6Z8_9EURO